MKRQTIYLFFSLLFSIVSVTANAQSLKGDLNGDGLVNAGDMTSLVNKILGLAAGSSAYDLNDDGKTNITDVVCLISIIVNQQISSFQTCPDDHHPHMIDLGLPSGVKWACCNVGATAPEAPGGYYAWGETEEKDTYMWSTYAHCAGTEETCLLLGDICGTEYDVAHVKWGGQWHMPNTVQIKELVENCTYEWTTLRGMQGAKFTSKANGAVVFLPAGGVRGGSALYNWGTYGDYWTGTPCLSSNGEAGASYVYNTSVNYSNAFTRYNGIMVRPVSSASVVSLLALSTSEIGIVVGNKESVEIASGSWMYTVQSSNEHVAKATIRGNQIDVAAVGTGNATITVTDTRNSQTATLYVTVIPSLGCCPDDRHPHMIDLGLPSGIKWSCCNVGATIPEGYGGYYAWGETEEKERHQWKTYQHCDGTQETCHRLGNIAGTPYDVAHVKWGRAWRMPTISEREELFSNCSVETITFYNLVCDKYTGPNGNSIVMPYGGGKYFITPSEQGIEPHYWTSEQNGYADAHYIYKRGLSGMAMRYIGYNVRPVYDPSLFTLSDETVDMFVNSSRRVTIEAGSGDYELQFDQNDIIDAELVIADKEEYPDAKDEIQIYGIAKGNVQLNVVDKEKNNTITIAVNVKTPTDNDVAITKEYSERVRDFVNQQDEMPVADFQDIVLSWLDGQDWVKSAVLSPSKESIDITFENGVCFVIGFQDMAFFEESAEASSRTIAKVAATESDLDTYDVTCQDGERILDNTRVLHIQGMKMRFDNSMSEYDELKNLKEKSPVNINILTSKHTLNVFNQSFSNYGMIFISQTHGTGRGGFRVQDDTWSEGYLDPGIFMYMKDGLIKKEKPDEDDFIFLISPRLFQRLNISSKTIIHGAYCWSYFLSSYLRDNTILGYNPESNYRENKNYIVKFADYMWKGYTFAEVKSLFPPYYVWHNWAAWIKYTTYIESNHDESKQRYFSINATKYLSEGIPVITGKINGYQNLKTDIQYYVYAVGKGNSAEVVPSDTQPISVNSDGTFCYEYSSFSGNPDDYNFYVGFEYNDSYYYGEAKDLCPDGNHPHAIDLSLPSGTQWACCNVDPNPDNQRPTNYGGRYAWGETEVKEMYHWESYIHCDGTEETIRDIGSNICATQYDVAFMKWNLYNLVSFWQMPSIGQIEELFKHCDYKRTKVNNTSGALFKSKINGNVIFLPAAGVGYCNQIQDPEILGFYWSGNIASKYRERACFFSITENDIIIPFTDMGTNRYLGCSVRPIVIYP